MSYLGDATSNDLEAQYDLVVKALLASDVPAARAAMANIPADYWPKVRQRLLSRKPPLQAVTVYLITTPARSGSSTFFVVAGLGLAALVFWKMR